MKKVLIMLLGLVMMCSTTASAWNFEGDFLDPFNNELFDVVAETTYSKEYNMEFLNYEMIYKEDFTNAKVVCTEVKYDGEVVVTDLCDYVDLSVAESYMPTYGEVTYNDGLIKGKDEELQLGCYKDVNGNVLYQYYGESYYTYDYNLGLLCEIENDGWTGDYENEREWKTTFTSIMTDNAKYEFNCAISCFNDDGYSIMRVNGKNYVIKLKKGIIPTVTYNNKKIGFDQIPVVENGRTLVPLRAIFETFGAQVAWDGDTNTVTATKDDVEVKLTIDSTVAYKNGEQITLDVPAKVVNGRTLVPVRFVSDCFDVNVEWDGILSRVILTK